MTQGKAAADASRATAKDVAEVATDITIAGATAGTERARAGVEVVVGKHEEALPRPAETLISAVPPSARCAVLRGEITHQLRSMWSVVTVARSRIRTVVSPADDRPSEGSPPR
jgi:hypothetical protein